MPIKVSPLLHSLMSKTENKTLSQEYKIEKNIDGYTNIIKNNRYIHSKYNVEKECTSILKNIDIANKKNIYAFYGFGLGYHLSIFAKNFNMYKQNKDNIYIIVFVIDVPLFVYAYYNLDMSAIAEFNSTFVYYNENIETVLKGIDTDKILGLNFITLPSIEREYKNYSLEVKTCMLQIIEQKFSDLFTRLHFESLWIKNILKNVSIIDELGSIANFKNALAGLNAIIIAAGPSLNNSIDAIKKKRESFFIIATDTAYSCLSKNKIEADIIITVDAGIYNVYDFINEDNSYPFLFMDIISQPIIAKINEKRANIAIFSSNENFNIINHIEEALSLKIQRLNISHTVATAAIDLAYFLGIKNAILIGFDNSYPNYERHAKHTLSFDYNLIRSDKLNTMESMYFDVIRKQSNMADYPPTSYVLENQINYLSELSYDTMEIIRLKSNAIKIDSIDKDISIEDYALEDCRKLSLERLLSLYKKNNVDKKEIKNMYIEIKDIFYNLIQELHKNYNLVVETPPDEIHCNEILNTVSNLLDENENKIAFLKNILSHTKIAMDRNTNYDTCLKSLFLTSESIKNLNYFHTRIVQIIDSIKD